MSKGKIKDIEEFYKIDTIIGVYFIFYNIFIMAKAIKMISTGKCVYNWIRKWGKVNIQPEYLKRYEEKGFIKYEDYIKSFKLKKEAKKKKEEKEKRMKDQISEAKRKKNEKQNRLDMEAEKRRKEGEKEEDASDMVEDAEEVDDPNKEDADFEKEEVEEVEEKIEEWEEEVEEVEIDLENWTKKELEDFCKENGVKVEWRNRPDLVKAIEKFIEEQNEA